VGIVSPDDDGEDGVSFSEGVDGEVFSLAGVEVGVDAEDEEDASGE
jgi:hypothetical protein